MKFDPPWLSDLTHRPLLQVNGRMLEHAPERLPTCLNTSLSQFQGEQARRIHGLAIATARPPDVVADVVPDSRGAACHRQDAVIMAVAFNGAPGRGWRCHTPHPTHSVLRCI